MTDRHSKAAAKELITNADERAKQEALNGLKQYDKVISLVRQNIRSGNPFRLRPSMICGLQAEALDGISRSAGQFRNVSIHIEGSRHEPPAHRDVAELVEDLCDYINDNWKSASPIHLAAYVMWRINWIHPFEDGNGRTSRAVSYLVLLMKLGYVLPGDKAIPDQISGKKNPYYEALEDADKVFAKGKIDLTSLEDLIGAALAAQLANIHQKAMTKSDN